MIETGRFDFEVFLAQRGFLQGQGDYQDCFTRSGYHVKIVKKKYKTMVVFKYRNKNGRLKHLATVRQPISYKQAKSLFDMLEIKPVKL